MFDSHVHAAPDVLDRIGDDIQVARAYELAGYSGFVLKAHYESTAGRAHGVAELTGRTVYGGVALNQHTGGVNPSAVASALSAGDRVVWMPTADEHTQQAAGLPRLCDHQPWLTTHAYAIPPVDPQLAETTDLVLALIAGEHLVLSSDAGQPDSPSPPEALSMLVDVLAAEASTVAG